MKTIFPFPDYMKIDSKEELIIYYLLKHDNEPSYKNNIARKLKDIKDRKGKKGVATGHVKTICKKFLRDEIFKEELRNYPKENTPFYSLKNDYETFKIIASIFLENSHYRHIFHNSKYLGKYIDDVISEIENRFGIKFDDQRKSVILKILHYSSNALNQALFKIKKPKIPPKWKDAHMENQYLIEYIFNELFNAFMDDSRSLLKTERLSEESIYIETSVRFDMNKNTHTQISKTKFHLLKKENPRDSISFLKVFKITGSMCLNCGKMLSNNKTELCDECQKG